MPNRILKESICISDDIDKLSWFEEALFYRLIVNCDDFGRFDGRTAVIKNRLFPLKDNLTLKTVEAAINKLVTTGLVVLYVFEDKPYLYLPTWNEHQSVRAKRSKYPAPENSVIASASNCMQVKSSASICSRNPIQSESESESESNTRESAFEAFWSAYPKKTGKGEAKKAFAKVKTPLDTLLKAVENQKRSVQWQKDGGQYIPNPATWLNQGRWEDELLVNTAAMGYTHEESTHDDLTLLRKQLGM